MKLLMYDIIFFFFFFSSRRRHTRCRYVTGVQTVLFRSDVPVATLNRVAADDFSWNVPGLREELVTGLIRSLPKHLRVNFVPAPNRAREFLAAVPAGEEPLLDALERWMRSTTGVVVPREAWDWSKVAPHLLPTYRVVDEGGAEQARGKDLEALKA